MKFCSFPSSGNLITCCTCVLNNYMICNAARRNYKCNSTSPFSTVVFGLQGRQARIVGIFVILVSFTTRETSLENSSAWAGKVSMDQMKDCPLQMYQLTLSGRVKQCPQM
uniref:Uncharacterized protein n=1 Tax=Micrurus corallinus TaxID=54390 RepID=A0A2D4G359_MICCO